KLRRLPDDVVDVEWRLIAAVRPGVVEELRHDPVQTIDLVDDDGEEFFGAAEALALGQKILRGAFDRAQWVSDFVRQTGRHLAERRQTLAFLHALVDLRVLDGDGGLRSYAAEEVDLVGGVGLTQALVAHAQKAQYGILPH